MQRFWVIGGEFLSLQFDKLMEGTQQVLGPFSERGQAENAWRSVSEQHRHRGCVRFAIVQEPQQAA